jgi:hypothetical protein
VLAAGAELVGWAAGAAALCVGDGPPADDAGALGLGDAVALGLGDELALWLGAGLGEMLTLGLGEMLTLGLGKLPTAFLIVLPHPAAIHAAARIAAERARLLLKRGMPVLSRVRCSTGWLATPSDLIVLPSAPSGPHPLWGS